MRRRVKRITRAESKAAWTKYQGLNAYEIGRQAAPQEVAAMQKFPRPKLRNAKPAKTAAAPKSAPPKLTRARPKQAKP